MKSFVRRLTALLLVVSILTLSCGITFFAAAAIDHVYGSESSLLSDLIKIVKPEDSATAVVEYPESQSFSYPAISTDAERILNIWETSPNDGALENVSFAVYKVCTLDEYYGRTVKLNTIPSEDEIDTYAKESNLFATITTDKNGYATQHFGYGENDGVYMVCQLKNAAIPESTAPFYVSFPMNNADNTALLYEIDVYPKNDIEITTPNVEKDITVIGNKGDSVNDSGIYTWIIRGTVPNDIADAVKYSLADILPENLEYIDGSAYAVLAEKNAKTGDEDKESLVIDADYTVDYAENGAVPELMIALTKQGMKNIAEAVGMAYRDYEIRVYLETKVTGNIQAGVEIKNDAEILYENSVGHEYVSEIEKIPAIVTGGINILKLDSKNSAPLAGAEFKIARDASVAEIASDLHDTIYADDGNGGVVSKKVVYVKFFDNPGFIGKMVETVKTDSDGIAYMYGLVYGNYYLVETKAPDGYNALKYAISVVVNNSTHLNGNCIKVINTTKSVLPSTDDIAAAVIRVSLIVFILATVVFALSNKKKKIG